MLQQKFSRPTKSNIPQNYKCWGKIHTLHNLYDSYILEGLVQVRNEYSCSQLYPYVCIWKKVQLKSILWNNGTWLATAWLPHHQCYSPAVFSGHICLTVFLFPQGKIGYMYQKCYCFIIIFFLLFKNCVSQGVSVDERPAMEV
jgi:hypothetical protein